MNSYRAKLLVAFARLLGLRGASPADQQGGASGLQGRLQELLRRLWARDLWLALMHGPERL